MSCGKPLGVDEFQKGYVLCDCGKYVYVFRESILRSLPKEYSGELCAECSQWVVAVDKLNLGNP